jgi:hypothetical protein
MLSSRGALRPYLACVWGKKRKKERRGERKKELRLRSRTPLYVPPPDRYRLTVNLTARIGVSATAAASGTAGTQYLGRHAKDTGARVADTLRWPMQDDITEWQGWPDDWLRALIWGTCRPRSQLEGQASVFAPLVTQQSKIEEGEAAGRGMGES